MRWKSSESCDRFLYSVLLRDSALRRRVLLDLLLTLARLAATSGLLAREYVVLSIRRTLAPWYPVRPVPSKRLFHGGRGHGFIELKPVHLEDINRVLVDVSSRTLRGTDLHYALTYLQSQLRTFARHPNLLACRHLLQVCIGYIACSWDKRVGCEALGVHVSFYLCNLQAVLSGETTLWNVPKRLSGHQQQFVRHLGLAASTDSLRPEPTYGRDCPAGSRTSSSLSGVEQRQSGALVLPVFKHPVPMLCICLS